jgi:cytochrome c oxidase assembly factor CtaG
LVWPFDPTVVVGILALGAGHTVWARRHDAPRSCSVYFTAGLVVIWAALETPLDPLGDHYLQSAHMVQHMLLVVVAPPLLLLGLTPTMAGTLLRLPGLRAVTGPIPGQCVYAAGILFWHIPAAFDAALTDGLAHIVEHLVFLAIGVLFWWPLIGATSVVSRWRLTEGQKLVYIFIGTLPMMAVALPLQFSRSVFYASYADAPRIVPGISAVIDQTIAGALMMAIDMVVLGFDGLVVLYRWFEREEPEEGALADKAVTER